MSTCKWAGTDNPRLLPGRHVDLCADEGCEGCRPCPERHCLVCRIEHIDGVCGECLGATRDDLAAIGGMWPRLEAEAINQGRAGDRDGNVLGGDAMVLLAMRYGDQTGAKAVSHEHERINDPVPVLVTLVTWEDCWRDYLEHPTNQTATVEAAVDYLNTQLTYMAGRTEIPFDDFAREIRQLRGRMEDVLYDGERDITGAPCRNCNQPLVRKVDARLTRGGYCEGHGPLNWCRLPHTACCDRGGARDEWECPRCHNVVTWAEYVSTVARDYQDNAEWLHAAAIEKRTNVAIGTIRVWVTRKKVRTNGKDSLGRVLYSVEDVERHAEDEIA